MPQPVRLLVCGAGGRAELAELLSQRRHRRVGLMQPRKRDLDGRTGLPMLLLQLALSEAQPVARVTSLSQSPLGVLDCRLHLDQRWSRGRSASSKMSTQDVAVASHGDDIGQLSDQTLSRGKVIDHGNLTQYPLHRCDQLVRYVDQADGVPHPRRKRW